MLPLRRQLFACAIGLLAAEGLRAAEWKFPLPPVTGELSGDFTPVKAAQAPMLHWTIAVQRAGETERDITVTVDGEGARLRASGRLDDSANGTWRGEEVDVDLARWFPALAAYLPAKYARMTLAGVLRMSGSGSWRDGKAGGRLQLALREGRIDDPEHKLLLEGVTLDLVVGDLAGRVSPMAQRLAWKGGRYDVITLGEGQVTFELRGDKVRVEQAELAVFAGHLSVGAFEFSAEQPAFEVEAKIAGAEVAMLLPLLPPIVSEARGRLDGTVHLRRDENGVQVGSGRLALRAGEKAELRLLPIPGVLGGTLPASVTKFYTGLADLEQGKVPLRASALEITFTPDGDAEGRSATVHVVGGPADPRLVAPVDLTVNVRGPLEWLVNFGTDSRLHWGGKR